MTRFLLATDSVHTTAAACDYLIGRLTSDDHVTVLSVDEPGTDPRDGRDALNVATVRLDGLATVEVTTREGDPATIILGVAADEGVDEVVLGPRGGAPGSGTDVGGTVRSIVGAAPVPVVVVPMAPLE